MRKLWKTTIVIWTYEDDDPKEYELSNLAWEAENGNAYCSKQTAELIDNPEQDPDWDGTEFFDEVIGL